MAQGGIKIGDLGPVRRAIAEAERTDESNAQNAINRFVELRRGFGDVLQSKRHHLLTGRRGTGKSTLLTVVRHELQADGSPVAVIDMEKYKGRPYPDVLIEILISLLDEVRPVVRVRSSLRDFRLRHKFNQSRKQLVQLLDDPQTMTNQIARSQHKRRGREINLSGRLGAQKSFGDLSATGAFSSNRSRSDEHMVRAEFERLKIERLRQLASRLSTELKEMVDGASKHQAIVFIDDFYYVKLEDQPDVLDYLQQVVKSTGIWLKIGGVGARMRPYRDGDPPTGMQPGQDIDVLTLDVTLNNFATAKEFLEAMMNGVLEPVKLDTDQLMTVTARDRMVLACGGAVARDYLTLTAAALDAATERVSRQRATTEATPVRIVTEDVNIAARERMNKKVNDDLELDAGADANELRERWRDICDFVRAQGNTAFILVRQEDIENASWGEEIRQLENLRLIHRIKDAVPNTPNWRGVKCIVFMIDLGQVANQRLMAAIPNFWMSTAEFDKLRRAEWVYAPQWSNKLAAANKKSQNSGSAEIGTQVSTHSSSSGNDLKVPTLFESSSEIDTAE